MNKNSIILNNIIHYRYIAAVAAAVSTRYYFDYLKILLKLLASTLQYYLRSPNAT